MILTKTYFKLLQAIHHVEILDEAARRGSPPPGMARKAQFLTSFIKPAAPNSRTLKLVEENTSMWMQRNLDILKTHYTDLLRDLSFNLTPFRIDAFDRAIIWAGKHYHNKLTPSSISALHSLLNTSDPLPSTPPFDITNPISDLADFLPSPFAFPTLLPFLQISPAFYRCHFLIDLPIIAPLLVLWAKMPPHPPQDGPGPDSLP
ncbi:hypothetical protein NQZ68_024411, partial [Dissostichus eleginoides]